MATRFPQSPEEFHSITGVGDHKLRKYGDVFLAEIEHYCRDYGLISAGKTERPEIKGKKSENEGSPGVCRRAFGERMKNSEAETCLVIRN